MHCSQFKSLNLLLIIIGVSTSVAQAGSQSRPNLLVILADDLGYADLQCCGSQDMQTPHLNALFHAGMKFTKLWRQND